MTVSQIAQATSILVAAGFIVAAIGDTGALLDSARGSVRQGWGRLRMLMGAFVAGYVVVGAMILATPPDNTGWAVCAVFVGGAAFVYFVVHLSVVGAHQLSDSTLSLESYQATLNTVMDAIITIDDRGIIQFVNEATVEMFGHAAEDMTGNNVSMLMSGRNAVDHDRYISSYLETGEAKIIGIGREVVGLRKDGSQFPAELAVSEMRLGGQHQFVGSIRDITERKRLDKMKSQFISTVSHELRTPLTSIRGSLGLLAAGVAGELSPQGRSLASIGVENTDRMIRLINDLLDVDKIRQGGLVIRTARMNLVEVVRRAVDENRTYADEHDVHFELEGPEHAWVEADHDRIRQVMDNLLSNAAKYASGTGPVSITIEANGGNWRLGVQDHGPGIPEEFQTKVFTRFSQAEVGNTRGIKGTGLGLAIIKGIIDQHQGVIDFRTGPTGTLFFFELAQLGAADQADSGSPLQSHAPVAARRKALVVEDDPDIAQLLELMLERYAITSEKVDAARSALDLLHSNDYDLITLDLNLADGPAEPIFEELAGTRNRSTPVIVISATAADAKQASTGKAITIVDWLEKPIESGRLASTVAAAFTVNRKPVILHVEDDHSLAEITHAHLQGIADLVHAPTLHKAVELLTMHSFDCIILDLGLPDGDGREVVRLLSGSDNPTPIIVYAGREAEDLRGLVAAILVKSKSTESDLISAVEQQVARIFDASREE